MAQATSKAPQVAAPQATPSTAGPTQAGPTQAGPAQAGAGRSNGAAQEQLAAKQARAFEPIAKGTVTEAHVDIDRLSAHVASLWGQMASASEGRTARGAETPVGSYEGSGLAEELRALAMSGDLVAQGGFESRWVNVGGMGVPGLDGLFDSPLAKAKLEVRPLAGDITPVSSALGGAQSTAGSDATRSEQSGGELGVTAGGLGARATSGQAASRGSSAGTSLSMPLQMTAYNAILGFDCRLRVQRTFGPEDTRSGRVVAGTVSLQSTLGYGA